MADSPVKKINFEAVGKENIANPTTVIDHANPVKEAVLELSKPVKPVEKAATPADLKALEAEEPILKDNPHRFVLFPIKYHEVRRRPQTHFLTRHALSGFRTRHP